MSHNIYLYKIDKRKNSTKLPGTGIQYSCTFKRPMNMLAPEVLLNIDDDVSGHPQTLTDLCKYNYMYIPSFGRYYFIETIISQGNKRVLLSAQVDLLATYRDSIIGYSGVLARTNNSNYYSRLTPDDNFITRPSYVGDSGGSSQAPSHMRSYSLFTNQLVHSYITYTWVVNGKDGVMIFNTPNSPETTLHELLDDASFWNDFQTGITDMSKYITSCIAVVGAFGSIEEEYQSHNITVANMTKNITECKIINPNSLTMFSESRTIPFSDFTFNFTNSDFRHYTEPFTQIQLFVPFVGTITIDPIYLNYSYLEVEYVCSPINGNGRIVIYAYDSDDVKRDVIGSYNINASLPIPFAPVTDILNTIRDGGNITNDILQKGSGAWNTVANNTSGLGSDIASSIGDMLGATGSIVNGAKDFVLNSGVGQAATNIYASTHPEFRKNQTVGSPGSLVDLTGFWNQITVMITEKSSSSDNFVEEIGYKSLQTGTVSTGNVTGGRYYQFVAPNISISGALGQEIAGLNQMLQQGIWAE